MERAHAVPGMLRALEKHATVLAQVERRRHLEIIEGRRRVGLETALVVEDQDVAAPLPRPVLVGGEEEDVRRELAPGIAVRRYGAALPGVVPFHREDDLLARRETQHAAQERVIGLAVELGDELLPGLGDLHPLAVVQDAAVVGSLPEAALHADHALELRHVGERRAETLPALCGQGALHVRPRVRLLRLEGARRNALDTSGIEIGHGSSPS